MALVSFPQGLWWPYQLAQGLSQPTANLTTLNTATQKTHMYGRMYIQGRATNKTLSQAGGGTITFVTIATTTFANAGTTLDVGLQDTNATGAPTRPDGTFDVKRTLTGGTDTLTNGGFNTYAMDTGSKTLSHGDLISLVFDLTARGGADSINIGACDNFGMFGETNSNQQHFPGANSFTGGAWSSSSSTVPVALITFDDGTLGFFDQSTFAGILGSESYSDSTNPDERGLIFQVPFPCQVDAFKAYLLSMRSASDFTFTIYADPLGTPTSIGSVSGTGAQMNTVNFGNGWVGLPLTTPVTLAANTDYCAALRVTSASASDLAFSPLANTAHRALYPAGTTIRKATRNNLTGAFTAESPATTMYNMGVRISAVDDGTGSGAGGGGTLVLRRQIMF